MLDFIGRFNEIRNGKDNTHTMDFTDEERRTGYREGFRRLENSSRDFM